MSPRALGLALVAYAFALAVLCVLVAGRFRLRANPPGMPAEVVASVWKRGALVAREVVHDGAPTSALLEQACADGGTLVRERVVASSPVPMRVPVLLAVSFVPGRDGVRARMGGEVVYVTPDDLLSAQAYDHAFELDTLVLTLGLNLNTVSRLLAERLHIDAEDVLHRVELERVRMERLVEARSSTRVTSESMTRDDVAGAVIAAGRYLARAVQDDGRFRYLVDAPTGISGPGYDWPRHAGATFFLAQAAVFSGEAVQRTACLRAAELLRTSALATCGTGLCIGQDAVVDLGSSALGALAFAEIVRTGLDGSYRSTLRGLAQFLRGQQRPDGEFMHRYLRFRGEPVDVQGLYYSSEAVLALAKTYRVLGDPADRDAASRGLAHLVGPAWSFFGDRYYFGEEHWTCQAVAELWTVAPDARALDFCLRWAAFNRRLQQREGDAPYDADGALGLGPILTPRLTPIASRAEAAVATLEAARAAGADPREIALLEDQLRRALALLLRHQLTPGPSHLFADPALVYGAFPGSEVDWRLRIDYTQHAGSALVRWLEVTVGPAAR